jgi:hypothetical protein
MRSQSRKLDRAIVEAAQHLEPRPDHYAVWLLQKRGDFSPLKIGRRTQALGGIRRGVHRPHDSRMISPRGTSVAWLF